MNPDADLLRALSLNLGHVSRQRMRYIQMELRRFAIDSRMKNERNFWTILENNGLRFPQRTANSFLTLIKDQRGINVEKAARYLKESQKRTRRDSVEAMVEGEIKAESRDKRSKEKSNYSAYRKMTKKLSLDEFRRVGRMVANASTITGRARDQTVYESIVDENPTVENEENEQDKTKTNEDSTNETILEILMNTDDLDFSEKDVSKPDDDSTISQSKMDDQPKKDYLSVPATEKKSLPTDFDPFGGLDESEHNVPEKIVSAKKKKKTKHKSPPCAIIITVEDTDAETQPVETSQPEKQDDLLEANDGNEHGNVSFILGDDALSESELKAEQFGVNENASNDQVQYDDKPPEEYNDNSSFAETVLCSQDAETIGNDEIVNKDDQATPSVNQEVIEVKNEITIQIESSPEISDESDQEKQQNGLIDVENIEANTAFNVEDELNSNNEDDTSKNQENSDGKTKIYGDEEDETKHATETQKEINNEQDKKDQRECISTEDVDKSTIAETIAGEIQDKKACQAEQADKKETNEQQENVHSQDTVSLQASASAPTQEEEALFHKNENLEIHNTPKETIESSPLDSVDETDPESVFQILKEQPVEEDLPEYSTDSFVSDEISEAGASEVQSSSCDDDADGKKETEFDTQSIADYGGEVVNVGDFEITMFPPEWQKDKEYTDTIQNLASSSEPKLEVDWVYCCEISHAQSMASLGDDELVYGSGCIVVLYNHVRNSQRHYTEHSGPISCVSVHPDQNIVGSAQSESATAENMIETVSEPLQDSAKIASNHGRIHIRVWNSNDLNTLYVMGVGTLQNTVRKMQFMNYKSYILTIEDDEAASLTLWDGGCKLKRMPTTVNFDKEPAEVDTQPKKKNLARSKYVRKTDNAPRGLAATSANSAGFAIAGREHLGFWRIENIDYYSSESADEEFVKISGPQRGDFSQHFLPRYVTCCVKAERAGERCYITGDTNGTILVWSESSKEAIMGAKHAHECPISCVLRTKAHIFSGGATDKTIRAFTWGTRELESVGSISLPTTVGQVATIAVAGANLFVGTTKNLICTVDINHPSYAFYRLKKTKNQNKTNKIRSGINRTPGSSEENITSSNIFGQWESKEIANGTKKEITCVCAADYFKRRNNRNLTTPSIEKPTNQRPSKSAGTRRQPLTAERPTRSARPYGNSKLNNKLNDSSRGASTSDGTPKLTIAFSSPKLRTNERILKRELLRKDDSEFHLPLFATENFVDKSIFAHAPFPQGSYSTHENKDKIRSSFFVSSSNDGDITIYDAKEHCSVGRMKLPTTREITCIDCFPKRSMIVLGSASGHVIITRVNVEGFEVASESQFRSKEGNSRKIRAIKFSKAGNKVAFSISKEIVIATAKSTGIQEVGRCIGHQSNCITSLDWSEVTFHGSELLRSSSILPEPEIFVWSTEPVENIDDLSTVRNIKWQTNTCSLDYAAKGVWDHFTNHKENSCFSVGEVKYLNKLRSTVDDKHSSGQFLTSNFANWRSTHEYDIPALHTTCCVGDVIGCVRNYHYPSIASYPNETVIRVFHSAVSNISRLPGRVVACGSVDRTIIQFSIEDETNKNTS